MHTPGSRSWRAGLVPTGRPGAHEVRPAALVVVAVAAGALGALGGVALRALVGLLTQVFTGSADPSLHSVGVDLSHPAVPWLGAGVLVAAPVLGGLLQGPVVHRWAPVSARGLGVPEVMLAVARDGGRVPPRVAAVKAYAASVCLGSGGSVGVVGPTVQIGAVLASGAGQLLRLPDHRLRAVVAAGAAAGITGAFDAPLAGALFAVELVLLEISGGALAVLALAVATGVGVGHLLGTGGPLLALPPHTVAGGPALAAVGVLGVAAGATGALFTRFLYATADVCDRLWRGPEWLRPAVGGLLLGGLLLWWPQLYGVGYGAVADALAGRFVLVTLLALVALKILATSLTLGVGGSGGVFAPALFVGAMLGGACGQVVTTVWPGSGTDAAAFTVIGMAAVLAGTVRAPATAVAFVVEVLAVPDLLAALLVAVLLAAVTSRLLCADTVYTRKLTRRGVALHR
ncbi:chloride channel protein [Isoptericola sediminis]|uniref:Chloride channel protein n=1 Tax=Isoptericola sediminis TaxID=2733572 RepID=A0A849JZI1_9MICO|nr:chloride channel protein [Isoptericola sediminis]